MAHAQLTSTPGNPLRGRVRAPGDKSISHRSLILGAMASGVTEVEGLLEGDDVLRTAAAMRAFGADVARVGEGAWRIEGRGGFVEPEDVVDCGNAGTGVRLIMGAAAGFDLAATFTGDSSLRKRPMGRVLEPLSQMGAKFMGRGGGRLPLTLRGGKLAGISYTLPMASAQVKSAVLLAGLNAIAAVEVREPEPTRDHTERMLRAFGVEVLVTDEPGVRVIRTMGQRGHRADATRGHPHHAGRGRARGLAPVASHADLHALDGQPAAARPPGPAQAAQAPGARPELRGARPGRHHRRASAHAAR